MWRETVFTFRWRGPACGDTQLPLLDRGIGEAEWADQAVEAEPVMDLHQGEVWGHEMLASPGGRVTQDGLHQLDLSGLRGRGVVSRGSGEHHPLQRVEAVLLDAGEAGHHPPGREDGHGAGRLPLDIEQHGQAGPLGAALQVSLAAHQQARHTVSQIPGAANWNYMVQSWNARANRITK